MDRNGVAVAETLRIEVVCATPDRQELVTLDVGENTTAAQAVEMSGILADFADVDRQTLRLGVWGREVGDGHVVKAGDRVELYRPLQVDPMDARRQRALKDRD
jgi:putative ubiquitin-RnfH superfamily antitoxin RatB of RatAB toxin-antitoxin module